MLEFLQRDEARVVIWLSLGVILVTVGFYVVGKVRENMRDPPSQSHDLITNFRELHSQGELTEQEYRTIKTKLAARLQQELKGKDEEG